MVARPGAPQVQALRSWLLQRAAWMDEQLLPQQQGGGIRGLPVASVGGGAQSAADIASLYLTSGRPPLRTFLERGAVAG